jgi:hypothetical protein
MGIDALTSTRKLSDLAHYLGLGSVNPQSNSPENLDLPHELL